MPKLQRLCALLGPQALLIACRKRTKQPTTKWRHLTIADMSDSAHLSRLNRATNIGVVLGSVSGGLCSIDIDDDDMVEPFLQRNPMLTNTLRTRAARGCNFWVRIEGEYPRTHHIKQDGATIGEFRANGSYTIISGTHPSGCQYEFVKEVRPIALSYQSLVWPESAKTPPTTSSVTLNSEICNLKSVPCTLYNKANEQQDDTPSHAAILASIASRKVATASFERTYPALAELYSDFIENRFRAVAGGRNSFLTEAIPFLYRAVSPAFVLPLVKHFYSCNQSLFKDPLSNHMQEAEAVMEGVNATYLNDLGDGEREIYTALNEREQNLFRLCRDLALTNEEKGQGRTFFAPMDKFGWRLGLKGMQVGRDLKTMEGYGIIRCVEKGKPWAKGRKALAGTYAWVLVKGK